jgi:hypothetical protein
MRVPDHWWECYNGSHLNDGKIISFDVVNRIPVITPILGTDFRVLFLRGCISLKHWSYRPLLRDSTSPLKSTCLLIRLKEAKIDL